LLQVWKLVLGWLEQFACNDCAEFIQVLANLCVDCWNLSSDRLTCESVCFQALEVFGIGHKGTEKCSLDFLK